MRAHGSKGEVVAVPLQGLSMLLYEGLEVALTPPALDRDRFCRVERLTESSAGALVRFSCAHTIADAQSLRGCYVLARRRDIHPGPLEVSVAHVLGRTVLDDRAGEIGKVREILSTPAHDVWTVSGTGYGDVLVPVIERVILGIPDEGPIRVHLMDGLLSANERGGSLC
ncbi:ribosome maturation factor RimM [Coriobacterium glomerans]|nr:16S rRNA processing protein RimM [Coriobacterium glomerans]